VAAAVRSQLREDRLPGGPVLDATQAHVWLLRRQSPDSRWQLLALCVVAAMEHGRSVLWARTHAGEAGPALVQAAANLAVERFWWLLREVGLLR
jgi:hypothetical protein